MQISCTNAATVVDADAERANRNKQAKITIISQLEY